MEANRPTSENSGIPILAQQNAQAAPDLLKILIRWKWLPILGSAIGATLGYLYFVQQAPRYKATAQIQVVAPPRDTPISTFDTRDGGRSRGDEIVVVKSSSVLRNAVEIGRLTEEKGLAGKSAEEIILMLRDPALKMLDVRLGSKDINSDIIDISVTTENGQLSAAIVQAIVAGYEEHVHSKINSFSKDMLGTLNRFSDKYEKSRNAAKAELDKLTKNDRILFRDGKPHDPVSDKIMKFYESISEIDAKTKNIEAVLQQVSNGRDGSRSFEELLRMLQSSTNDNSYKNLMEGTDLARQRDIAMGLLSSIEQFEGDRVIPLRSELDRLSEQNLGDSHPSMITARQRLTKYQEELDRRKTRYKAFEEEYLRESGSVNKDAMSAESRLSVAFGALKETLAKLAFERNQFVADANALKAENQENQALISNYAYNLADLEAVKEIGDQTRDAIRKLDLGTDFGVKSVTRLEIPNNGVHAGPFFSRYLGIGALIGFILFSGLAYLLELADRSYRNPDEIANDLGMPIIGHLPLATISRADRIDDKVDSSVVTLHKNRSSISEAFRGIRTAVFFACQQGNIKVIQVTSPVPGDGKSTVAANIAVSIAQSGRRVCLIDCDFRRPRVAKMFGLKEDTGLVQVIGGKTEIQDAIQETSIPNLFSLTCGRRPGNPSELLSSEAFSDALAYLRENYDFVLVDTPPMLVVSDPANVASMVDGVILTVRLRRNLKPIATRASQMLHSINANMLGVVVNGIGVGGNGYGYGGYRYDNYNGGSSGGYGKSGYGGYGYGSTYQYGGYYGGTMIGRDYYDDQIPTSKKSTKVASK